MRDPDYDGGLGLARPPAGAQRLERDEAMRLLASVDYGRVVFTLNALPAIRPVNHLVDDDQILIRTRLNTGISTAVRAADPGLVVAYEADSFDSERRVGWSVVATAMRGLSTTRTSACVTNNCCIRGSTMPTQCSQSPLTSSPPSASSPPSRNAASGTPASTIGANDPIEPSSTRERETRSPRPGHMAKSGASKEGQC